MKIALISDIHGNEQALDAVLLDIKQQSIDYVVCLGDIVTLGPSPKEVIKKIRKFSHIMYYR